MIKLNKNGSILEFNFLNGKIYLDESRYGAYAICPGCGSGKTTIIKQLIQMKWNEGILYSAFTKNEVNDMYQFCKTIVGSELINMDGSKSKLSMNDIIVLHSDYTAEGTDNNLWRNNPTELSNKKIILCTHAKLLDEPLDLLVSSNFNKCIANSVYPPTYRAMHGISSMPRQWILIDESTEARMTLAYMKKIMFTSLGKATTSIKILDDGVFKTKKIQYPIIERNSVYYKDFVEEVLMLKKLTPEFRSIIKDETNELNKIRNNRLLENLYLNFQIYANSDLDPVKISSSYTDMITNGIKSHVLLFDGTSDITLYSSNKFKVLRIEDKYNSKLNLYKFPFNLPRKIKGYRDGIEEEIRIELDKLSDSLYNIIMENNKTLIFTWMNLKADNSESEVYDLSPNIINNNFIGINKNFSMPSYIKSKLEQKGLMEGVNFSIEYYGSGKDKAINDYRDYDAVVLAGKYQVPNNVIRDYNIMFESNITPTEYYANRVIQAICRTRVRNHNNESVNIYITDDWSNDVINYIKWYLRIDKAEMKIDMISNSKDLIDKMYEDLIKVTTPKKAEQIAKLSLLDPNIFNSIIEGRTYKCDIKLNDIFRILPKAEKESRRYDSIKGTLSKLGVILNII